MQIVIDIPEEMYQKIKETSMVISGRRSGKRFDYILFNAVNIGTPLDKIRAEIHATAEMHEDGDYYLRDEWIDEIFDKYKSETENT